jgi:hypothetical protein
MELDIAIDTELRERALEAVRTFLAGHGTPVSRSQIKGLLQVAANEPTLLDRYAGKQKERAQKRELSVREDRRDAFRNEAQFWELIQLLCQGRPPKAAWSLEQMRAGLLPAEYVLAALPPGARLSPEEQSARGRKKTLREEWERRWNRDYYPGFFRHFCAEYLLHLPHDSK